MHAQRRMHAFESARSAFTRDLDLMGDLSLDGQFEDADDDSDDPSDPTVNEDMIPDVPENATNFPLSPSNFPLSPSAHRQRNRQQKAKRKKTPYRPWAKNLLMLAESLNSQDGLPHDLDSAWVAVVPPRGKRVLCVSGAAGDTELMSRVSGKTLARVKTALPPNCYLDAVFDREQGALFVLDLIRWRGVFYLESEFTFR